MRLIKMKHTSIAEIMTRNIERIAPERPLSEAAERMDAGRISSLLVVEDGQHVGILTERDLLHAVSRRVAPSTPVSALMGKPLVSVPMSADHCAAYHVLASHGIRHLLVVDEAGLAVGVVSETDFRRQGGIEDFIRLRDVASAMSANLVMLEEQASVADAAAAMEAHKVDCALVGTGRRPVGIVSERDMVRLFREGRSDRLLGEVMTRPLATVGAEIPLQEAALRMSAEGIRRLVVVDREGYALGLLGEHDLVRQMEDGYVEVLQGVVQEQAQKLVHAEHALREQELREAVHATELRYRALLDHLPQKIFIKDRDSVYLACNAAYAGDLGLPPDAIAGHGDFDFFPDELARRYRDDDRRVVSESITLEVEEPYLRNGEEQWIHTVKMPWRDTSGNIVGVVGIFADITARKRLERALQRRNALYAVLSHTNQAIVQLHDRQALFDRVCDIALEAGGFLLAWIGMEEEETGRVLPVASAGSARDYLSGIDVHTRADLPTGRGPAGVAIREARHVVINDFLGDSAATPWKEAAMRHGLKSSIALPIQGGGRRGVLMVYAGEAGYFDDEVVELLLEVAADLSFALRKLQESADKDQAEARLRLHAQVFEESAEAMTITDADNNIMMVNPAFTQVTGYTLDEVRGHNPRLLKSGRHDAGFYADMWQMLLRTGFWQGEMWDRRKNGEVYPEWVTINAVRAPDGRIVNYFAVFSDLTQKRAEQELHRLKRYDALTDLPNRLLMEDRVSEAIAHARKHERHVGLLFINLDHFHMVNDLLGHVVGDAVLKSTAARLLEVVGSQGTVSRLSGDTFVAVLPDLNQPHQIEPVAEGILAAVGAPFHCAERDIHLSGRVGVAVFPGDGTDFGTLMQSADSALLHAKEEGRNTYRYFTADMNRQAEKIFTIGAEVRSAMEQGRLHLHYQPQLDMLHGTIVGVEALARITHPERGMISPADFIPVAEATGLILPLGEWVLREACRQLKQWQDDGLGEFTMAVNVSPLQLRQPDLVGTIARALRDTGLEARFLELEFTEGAVMKNVDANIELMKQLKALGVRLSIDDFGTGYSSLNYLKQFPVDKLKIDQSFVRNITSDPNDSSIVQAIIALARTLGLTTVAEGVETEAQLNYLRSLRCDEIQGYYFSRPIEARAIPEFFSHSHAIAATSPPRTLLIVDDEENLLSSLRRLLRREDYAVITATSAEEGLELMARHEVAVVVSDQRMPDMSGVEFLRRVKTMHPKTVRIILSGYADINMITDAINTGEIYKFIGKPWANEALVATIRTAFERHENLQLQMELP